MPDSNTEFIGQVSPRDTNERWIADPNPNLPREMTVSQTENEENSESD